MENKINYLIQNGMDIESALSYLGDYDMINEILLDFYNGIDDQVKQLEDLKNSNDMTNYAIYVHALKSNYRSLGLKEYAEVCYQHELKSKENDSNFVNENFNLIVEDKEKFKKVVENYKNL